MTTVHIIGAGLAGCECAHTLALLGIPSRLYEMKPKKHSPAHHLDTFAELVCSNSLKAERTGSASGMLKREMEELGSLLLHCAKRTRVPAGGALAVDRANFSKAVTEAILKNPLVTTVAEEVTEIPNEGISVIATGPLTSEGLSQKIEEICGEKSLSFFDAAAPIVTKESVDMKRAFFGARYQRGEDDYLNCPMEKEEYEAFVEALLLAQRVELKEFEKDQFRVYEGCMPVEVLASRGKDTLRFGPLRPVGLLDPRTGRRPYAVVQLRAENREGSLYNLVGFQTNLKFPEQRRVFSMIPALGGAQFERYGVMHRNTFLDAPRLLASDFSLKDKPEVYFAGQITGVEGYMESAAIGIVVGYQMALRLKGEVPMCLPADTMLGALCHHVTDDSVKDYQPMGANMGILPPLDFKIKGKQERYQALSDRGFASLRRYLLEDGEEKEGLL